jgi:hypothetical protein
MTYKLRRASVWIRVRSWLIYAASRRRWFATVMVAMRHKSFFLSREFLLEMTASSNQPLSTDPKNSIAVREESVVTSRNVRS